MVSEIGLGVPESRNVNATVRKDVDIVVLFDGFNQRLDSLRSCFPCPVL